MCYVHLPYPYNNATIYEVVEMVRSDKISWGFLSRNYIGFLPRRKSSL